MNFLLINPRELNPHFNEQFKFFVGPHSPANLEIFVFDEDTNKQDDFLGHISIPIGILLDQQKIFEDYFNLAAHSNNQTPLLQSR